MGINDNSAKMRLWHNHITCVNIHANFEDLLNTSEVISKTGLSKGNGTSGLSAIRAKKVKILELFVLTILKNVSFLLVIFKDMAHFKVPLI